MSSVPPSSPLFHPNLHKAMCVQCTERAPKVVVHSPSQNIALVFVLFCSPANLTGQCFSIVVVVGANGQSISFLSLFMSLINLFLHPQPKYFISVAADAYVGVTTGSNGPVAFGCSKGVNVREQEGQLVLELTRSGNVDSEVTVSCITQHDTAFDNIDYEGINQSVTFGPRETSSRCRVRIYDDSVYEAQERFYVFVTGMSGQLISSTLENIPICVYIVYDPNDGTHCLTYIFIIAVIVHDFIACIKSHAWQVVK